VAATSNDYPGLPFVQAAGYTPGRPDGPPLWIVWHTMEAGEHSTRAENTAAYFADPSDGRQVSAHWCVDDNSVVQSVDEDDSAWTVGNRPGNYRGLNVELSGFARQTEAEWLDPFGLAMFAQIAPVVAHSMRRWGIPNAWRSVADLRNMRPGHTTHADLGAAFGGTDHTDPGPHFPRAHVLQVVGQALEGTMTVEYITPEAWVESVRRDGAVDAPWDAANPQVSVASALTYLQELARSDRDRGKAAAAVLDQHTAQLAAIAADVSALTGAIRALCELLAAAGGPTDVAALTGRVDRLAAALGAAGRELAAADPAGPP
jgi:hypothetical protein